MYVKCLISRTHTYMHSHTHMHTVWLAGWQTKQTSERAMHKYFNSILFGYVHSEATPLNHRMSLYLFLYLHLHLHFQYMQHVCVCNGHSTAFYLTLIIERLFAVCFNVESVTISKSVLLLFWHVEKSDLVNQFNCLSIDTIVLNGWIIFFN